MGAVENPPRSDRDRLWLVLALLGACGAWAYYPTVRGLLHTWNTDPNYSQGYLIPALALGLLLYRARGTKPALEPSPVWGLGLLLVAAVFRVAAAYFFISPFDHFSLWLTIAGACVFVGGRPWFVLAAPVLVLLLFMFPIPESLGGAELPGRLQSVATRASAFALQTLGVVVAREGNVLLLKGTELGVVEACSGLRMLMVFCALAFVTAVLAPVGWARKAVLIVGAVPLAILCNVIRITAAGLASESLGTKAGYIVFHDIAGALMVPLAFLLLGGEVYLLSKLFRAERPGADEGSLRAVALPPAEPVTGAPRAVAPPPPAESAVA